jgi:hypothetical protein
MNMPSSQNLNSEKYILRLIKELNPFSLLNLLFSALQAMLKLIPVKENNYK